MPKIQLLIKQKLWA